MLLDDVKFIFENYEYSHIDILFSVYGEVTEESKKVGENDKIYYKVSYDGNEYSIETTYDYKIMEK